jgi:tetratricopeptide (TPR) repeat protein
MSNNITPEMLIQYLDNELAPQERLQVESQLSADAALQQQLERLRLAKQAFKQYARKQQVAAIHSEMIKRKPRKTASMLRMTMRVAAAIIVLVLIAGLIQYSLLDAGRLYRSQYQSFTLGTSRDVTGASTLEQAYRNGNLQQVVALYESNAPKQSTDHFLAGQAYLSTGNPQQALRAFAAQRNTNAALDLKPYQDDLDYYMALAWLKAGNTGEALAWFEKIHNQPTHAYHDQVSGWYLTKLRWLNRKQGK